MSSPQADLLGLPTELRFQIYEHLCDLRHGDTGTTYTIRINGDPDSSGKGSVRNILALRRVCRPFRGEVDQLLASIEYTEVEFFNISHDDLDSWLNLIGPGPLKKAINLEWTLSSTCHFAAFARGADCISYTSTGAQIFNLKPRTWQECHHRCSSNAPSASWRPAKMAAISQSGICRLQIDLQGLRHDIATEVIPKLHFLMPPQSRYEPFLIEKGYVRAFYCGNEDAHWFNCRPKQAEILRMVDRRVCDRHGNVGLDKEVVMAMYGLAGIKEDGEGRVALQMTFAREGRGQ